LATKAGWAKCLAAFKDNRVKIRQLLITLHGIASGVLGEDAIFGLQIEAEKALKL